MKQDGFYKCIVYRDVESNTINDIFSPAMFLTIPLLDIGLEDYYQDLLEMEINELLIDILQEYKSGCLFSVLFSFQVDHYQGDGRYEDDYEITDIDSEVYQPENFKELKEMYYQFIGPELNKFKPQDIVLSNKDFDCFAEKLGWKV